MRLMRQARPALIRPCSTVLHMAKAARVLAALKRDGWIESRRSGSHRVLAKGGQQRRQLRPHRAGGGGQGGRYPAD